jgi:hypothetical protein
MFSAAGVRFRTGGKRFSLLQRVQTGSEIHAAHFLAGASYFLPGVKHPRDEIDHSSPTSVEIKNDGAVSTYTRICTTLRLPICRILCSVHETAGDISTVSDFKSTPNT